MSPRPEAIAWFGMALYERRRQRMRKKEDDGTKIYAPTLNAALDANARDLAAALTTPRPTMGETLHRGKVTHTRPGYQEQAQVPHGAGRIVSNNTRAPLAGGGFRIPIQAAAPPGWLEQEDERGSA